MKLRQKGLGCFKIYDMWKQSSLLYKVPVTRHPLQKKIGILTDSDFWFCYFHEDFSSANIYPLQKSYNELDIVVLLIFFTLVFPQISISSITGDNSN